MGSGDLVRRYRREALWPDPWTGHYADGALGAALLEEHSGVPFTFTSHSLGGWKLDRLLAHEVAAVELSAAEQLLPVLDAHYNFGARIAAERVAMARGDDHHQQQRGKVLPTRPPGLLADPDDYAEHAEQLLRLIGDPEAWRAYAARGCERVLKLYNWRRTAESYARLAAEITRGERAGDASFPLPDFARRSEPVELPRLRHWLPAGVLPNAYCS